MIEQSVTHQVSLPGNQSFSVKVKVKVNSQTVIQCIKLLVQLPLKKSVNHLFNQETQKIK